MKHLEAHVGLVELVVLVVRLVEARAVLDRVILETQTLKVNVVTEERLIWTHLGQELFELFWRQKVPDVMLS